MQANNCWPSLHYDIGGPGCLLCYQELVVLIMLGVPFTSDGSLRATEGLSMKMETATEYNDM